MIAFKRELGGKKSNTKEKRGRQGENLLPYQVVLFSKLSRRVWVVC
jgi:hypothetical protein